MKIIVDRIPTDAYDCLFMDRKHYECKLNGDPCGFFDGGCRNLKPITDFHAERIVQKNNDGSYISQSFDIR